MTKQEAAGVATIASLCLAVAAAWAWLATGIQTTEPLLQFAPWYDRVLLAAIVPACALIGAGMGCHTQYQLGNLRDLPGQLGASAVAVANMLVGALAGLVVGTLALWWAVPMVAAWLLLRFTVGALVAAVSPTSQPGALKRAAARIAPRQCDTCEGIHWPSEACEWERLENTQTREAA